MTQKIVTPQEMKSFEEKAFQSGITQEMLMNEAGKKITERVIEFIEENGYATKIYVLAGKGNNGGDAYTAAKRLYELGFFLGQGWNHIGELICLPIGLAKFASDYTTELEYFEKEDASKLLPKIERSRHKYQAGHVVGLAGSAGMTGAAIMASWACLRS